MPSRIRNGHNPDKKQEEFRQYNDSTPPGVREFYRLNHTHQTVDFVREKKQQYLAKQRGLMSIWEALDYLNTLVDESDPDTDLSQIEHNLQTAEAIRRDCYPRCFVLAGFIHRAVVLPPHCAQTYRRGRAGCWVKRLLLSHIAPDVQGASRSVVESIRASYKGPVSFAHDKLRVPATTPSK